MLKSKTFILLVALAISSMMVISSSSVYGQQKYSLDTVKVKGLVQWLESFKLINHQAGHNTLEGGIPVMIAFQDTTYQRSCPNPAVKWGINIGTKSMNHPYRKVEIVLNLPNCKSIILNIADECLPIKNNSEKEMRNAKTVQNFLESCGIHLRMSAILGE